MNTSQTGQMCSDTSPYKVVCEYYDVRPGLVIMGGDSSTRGHEFESQYHIIFHIYVPSGTLCTRVRTVVCQTKCHGGWWLGGVKLKSP